MQSEPFLLHEPTSRLKPFVRLIWSVRFDSATMPNTFPILPQGLIELVFHEGGRIDYQSGDGDAMRLPPAVLAGALTRRIDLSLFGALNVIGVQFYPASVAAFGLSRPSALADAISPLESLAGSNAGRLRERLSTATSARQRVTTIQEWLMERLSPPDEAIRAVRAAVDLIMARSGNVRIGNLCSQIGTSRRSLERAFSDHVGMPPKILCEILRFQSTIHLRRSVGLSWSDAAALSGFADQAHLVREIGRFAGASPTQLFRGIHPITARFAGIQPPT